MSVMNSSEEIDMPIFGRTQLTLGSLYDCRNERHITGFKLWNESDLVSSKLDVSPKSLTTFNLIASNKWNEKLSKLQLNASMKLSILGGLIEPSGSTSYLNSTTSSSEELSVHVHCEILTKTKSLTMEHHLAKGKIPHIADLVERGTINKATHVISQIQYGAGATFTLKVKKSQIKGERDIQGKLESAGRKLMDGLKIQGNVEGALKDNDSELEDNFECDLNCDFLCGASPPTKFIEALKFAKDLIKLMKENMDKDVDGSPLGVPQRMWLKPLIHLSGAETAPTLSPLIIEDVANDFVRLIDELDELKVEAYELINNSIAKKLKVFENKVMEFCLQIDSYKIKLQREMQNILIRIRNKPEDGNFELRKLFKTNVSSSFNPHQLKKWIKDKHFEISLVKRFEEQISSKYDRSRDSIIGGRVKIFPSEKEITRQITAVSGSITIHFVFTSLVDAEPLIEDMKRHLQIDQTDYSIDSNSTREPWYKKCQMVEFMEEIIETFHLVIDANLEESPTMSFAVTFLDSPDFSVSPGATVQIYQNGILKQTVYNTESYNDVIIRQEALGHYLKYCSSKKARQTIISHHFHVPDCMFHSPDWHSFFTICNEYQQYQQYKNYSLIVKLLILSNDLDVNEVTYSNRNIFHQLCKYYTRNNLIEIIQFIITIGIADVGAKTDEGWNALHFVCANYSGDNLIEIIRLFIDNGIDVNAKTNNNWNALHFVCRHYSGDNLIEIIRLFIDKKIDVIAKTDDNCNALHFVCRNYSGDNLINIVRLLIDKGINVNAKDNEDWNALHVVCCYNNGDNLIEIVRLLIDSGINVKAKALDISNSSMLFSTSKLSAQDILRKRNDLRQINIHVDQIINLLNSCAQQS